MSEPGHRPGLIRSKRHKNLSRRPHDMKFAALLARCNACRREMTGIVACATVFIRWLFVRLVATKRVPAVVHCGMHQAINLLDC
jgi:hypothetical protein